MVAQRAGEREVTVDGHGDLDDERRPDVQSDSDSLERAQSTSSTDGHHYSGIWRSSRTRGVATAEDCQESFRVDEEQGEEIEDGQQADAGVRDALAGDAPVAYQQ